MSSTTSPPLIIWDEDDDDYHEPDYDDDDMIISVPGSTTPTPSRRVNGNNNGNIGNNPVSASTPGGNNLSKSARRRQRQRIKLISGTAEIRQQVYTASQRATSSTLSTADFLFDAPPTSQHKNKSTSQTKIRYIERPHSYSATSTSSHPHSPPTFRHVITASPQHVHTLCDMFPTYDTEVLRLVLEECGNRLDDTIHHLLESTSIKLIPPSISPIPTKRLFDTLSSLPSDAFHPICSYLDMFSLAQLSCCCHEMDRCVRDSFTEMTQLHFARYRHWPDWKILRMIQKFTSVQHLSLKKCHAFRSFDRLPETCFGTRLLSMNYSGCLQMSDIDVSTILTISTHLESLDLSHLHITDDALEYICNKNNGLERLSLNECGYITSHGISRLLRRCTDLRTLDLRGTGVTRDAFHCQHTHDSKLQTLLLSKTQRLGTLIFMCNQFQSLIHLNVSNNSQLTMISLYLPVLQTLNVSQCKSLVKLYLHAPLLHTLNASNCISMTHLLSSIPSNQAILSYPLSPPTNGNGHSHYYNVLAHLTSQVHHAPEQVIPTSSLIQCNFTSCRSLMSYCFRSFITSSCTTLQFLKCTGMLTLMDEDVFHILDKCEVLTDCDLSGCRNLSPGVITRMNRVMEQRVVSYLHTHLYSDENENKYEPLE